MVAGRIGHYIVEKPMVLGHESSGIVSKGTFTFTLRDLRWTLSMVLQSVPPSRTSRSVTALRWSPVQCAASAKLARADGMRYICWLLTASYRLKSRLALP